MLDRKCNVLGQVKGQTEDVEVTPVIGLLAHGVESVIGRDGRRCNSPFSTSKHKNKIQGSLTTHMGSPATVYPDMHKAFLKGLYQRRAGTRAARITHMNASREEKVSSMMRSPPSIRSSHLWMSPVGGYKSVRVAEMKLNARPHRSCSETGQEWSGGSLELNVRQQLDSDGRGGNGTLFGDVPYFDGVGFAIESKDRVIRRHCGRFTRHREKELARDGEAREEERGGGIRATSERWDPTDGGGQRMRNQVEPIILVFIPHEQLSSIFTLPCGRFDATQANLNPCDPKVNSVRLITGGLRDDGRVGVVHARESS